ncbi:SpoIIE family protein phosphatase [Sphingomonas sp. MAH-20]|uniref:SpoIIE family protein phosphatase n=1 Tax=Sphingomonas horti TaxID=2682842 RepID=A0A6I4IXG0_9SPHN|nr:MULTISPECIES: protein phosphatase 2C domain-containing protein [Sphingomonas]MBA2920533.1 serine/threonine-protein phosphatase [Sphingomonas sp. CGMCC 1.13658]MVO76785.1 SpoIIE family protein phosphatase [Sphingomonas horti]
MTDVGAVREVNEDRYLASETLRLWAVADGMGGMSCGDWAAARVIDALAAIERSDDLNTMVASAAAALEKANRAIIDESEARGEQMGTTAVVAVVRDDSFGVIWVGDSRAYLVRDRRLHRLTRDHSQVQELVDHGLLEEAAAATHPLRNVLTRAVGISAPLDLDMVSDTLRPDDLLLLCSDGLYGVLGEAEMEAIINAAAIEEAGEAMIARCHELGAPDNITMVAITATEPTLVHFGEINSRITG